MGFLLSAAAKVTRGVGLGRLVEYARRRRDDPNPYRTLRGPAVHLGAASLAAVERPRRHGEARPQNDIYEAWRGVPGGHKWLHYFEAYDDVFDALRARPIRMLEIGVYQGASLEMWRRYLHPDSVIVGIDIDPTCARFEAAERKVHVRIGSQADPVFLAAVVKEFGPFDVILDDGSHVCSHMIKSFDELFLAGLRDDGLYIAEDTHTNFWPEYRDQPYSFIDLCKDLVDYMHWHHIVMPDEINYRLGLVDDRPPLPVPRISAQIREIRFLDSIVVIRKRPIGPLPASQHR
jgi:hypothetical protein